MPRLCASPPGAGAGMPSETWGQASFLSSHAPSEAEHLVPKEVGRGRNMKGGLSADSHSSGCQPLIPGSHFFPLYAPPPLSPNLPPFSFPCCSAVWLSAVRLRNGRRDRGLLPGEMVKRGLGPTHKCINGAYLRQLLSNWEHVVVLNIFSLLWLYIQMHRCTALP